MAKWIHPIHGKGLRSPDLTKLMRGDVLSNRKIDAYAREGRYGPEEQEKALKKSRKGKTNKRTNLLAKALKELLGL